MNIHATSSIHMQHHFGTAQGQNSTIKEIMQQLPQDQREAIREQIQNMDQEQRKEFTAQVSKLNTADMNPQDLAGSLMSLRVLITEEDETKEDSFLNIYA